MGGDADGPQNPAVLEFSHSLGFPPPPLDVPHPLARRDSGRRGRPRWNPGRRVRYRNGDGHRTQLCYLPGRHRWIEFIVGGAGNNLDLPLVDRVNGRRQKHGSEIGSHSLGGAPRSRHDIGGPIRHARNGIRITHHLVAHRQRVDHTGDQHRPYHGCRDSFG